MNRLLYNSIALLCWVTDDSAVTRFVEIKVEPGALYCTVWFRRIYHCIFSIVMYIIVYIRKVMICFVHFIHIFCQVYCILLHQHTCTNLHQYVFDLIWLTVNWILLAFAYIAFFCFYRWAWCSIENIHLQQSFEDTFVNLFLYSYFYLYSFESISHKSIVFAGR